MDLQNRARSARTALNSAFASVVFKEIFPELSDATFLPTAKFSRLVELGKERKRADAAKRHRQPRDNAGKLKNGGDGSAGDTSYASDMDSSVSVKSVKECDDE
jgi:hypothetical protein